MAPIYCTCRYSTYIIFAIDNNPEKQALLSSFYTQNKAILHISGYHASKLTGSFLEVGRM